MNYIRSVVFLCTGLFGLGALGIFHLPVFGRMGLNAHLLYKTIIPW